MELLLKYCVRRPDEADSIAISEMSTDETTSKAASEIEH